MRSSCGRVLYIYVRSCYFRRFITWRRGSKSILTCLSPLCTPRLCQTTPLLEALCHRRNAGQHGGLISSSYRTSSSRTSNANKQKQAAKKSKNICKDKKNQKTHGFRMLRAFKSPAHPPPFPHYPLPLLLSALAFVSSVAGFLQQARFRAGTSRWGLCHTQDSHVWLPWILFINLIDSPHLPIPPPPPNPQPSWRHYSAPPHLPNKFSFSVASTPSQYQE